MGGGVHLYAPEVVAAGLQDPLRFVGVPLLMASGLLMWRQMARRRRPRGRSVVVGA